MADQSKIEWTDATWTPIQAIRKDNGKRGVACVKVSPACQNCYAERLNMRSLPNHGTGLPFTVQAMQQVDIILNEGILMQPLRWKKPRRIFVCSQTDLFGDFVSDEQIDRIFSVMAIAQQHTFQVLTKRPERMKRYFQEVRPNLETAKGNIEMRWQRPGRFFPGLFDRLPLNRVGFMPWPLSNVWLGVTAENEWWADKRITVLLQTLAAKRFVSVEPMLGPVDIARHLQPHWSPESGADSGPWLGWVICGGESGPGARPMRIEWAELLRDQCAAAAVPFFMKQLGVGPIWAGAAVSPIEPSRGKNGVAEEWPESLRVREFPNA